MGARRIAWVIAVALPLALTMLAGQSTLGAGATTTGKPQVDWNCTAAGLVKPTQIILACGDGNAVAEQLHWTKWTGTRAVGAGFLRQNDCAPDCADGTFHNYPARFTLSETTSAGHVRYFTRVTISFTGMTPLGRKTELVKDCWANPPTPGQPKCPADLLGAG
jgi:hypothetical protein